MSLIYLTGESFHTTTIQKNFVWHLIIQKKNPGFFNSKHLKSFNKSSNCKKFELIGLTNASMNFFLL